MSTVQKNCANYCFKWKCYLVQFCKTINQIERMVFHGDEQIENNKSHVKHIKRIHKSMWNTIEYVSGQNRYHLQCIKFIFKLRINQYYRIEMRIKIEKTNKRNDLKPKQKIKILLVHQNPKWLKTFENVDIHCAYQAVNKRSMSLIVSSF